MPKHTCTKCNLEFIRIHEPKGKSYYRYVDDRGKRWNGSSCPTCTNSTKKTSTVSHSKALNVKPSFVRVCRKCNKDLPSTHYFLHPECRDFDWDELDEEYLNVA